ncbi:hypothetical protein ACWF7H_15995 [Peribacillus butanolivorans]
MVLLKLGSVLDAAHHNIKTNLKFDSKVVVAKNMMGMDVELEIMQIKCDDQYIDGVLLCYFRHTQC